MASQPRPSPDIEPESTPAPKEDGVSRRDSVRRSRFKFRSPVVLIPLALVLIAGGVLLWLYFGSYETTDDAQVDVHLYPVSPRIAGYVTKVNVNDNQYVEQGTVLVEVDPRDY